MSRKKITKKTKRRLTFLSCAIFLLIGAIIASVFNDLCQVIHNKNEISLLESEYDTLLKNQESLKSEITKLQDSDYVARYAREKYLYSLPDEVIIKLPDSEE
jgi:cell division protein DivIC